MSQSVRNFKLTCKLHQRYTRVYFVLCLATEKQKQKQKNIIILTFEVYFSNLAV